MSQTKKLMAMLLSAIMFLGAAVTPVVAEDGGGSDQIPTQPGPIADLNPEETIDEEPVEEVIPEEEVISEETEENAIGFEQVGKSSFGGVTSSKSKEALTEQGLIEIVEENLQPLAEDDPPVLGTPSVTAPHASKDLESNHDGTYTLSLSITGQAESDSIDQVHRANLVIVLDRSNSMDTYTTYTYNANTYGSNYEYYRRYTYWGQYAYARVYYSANGSNGAGWYDNQNGTGTRRVAGNGSVYVTRLTAAQMAINALSKELLSKNTQYDDLIELEVISFASVRGSTVGTTAGHGTNDGSAESPWVKGTDNSTLMTYVNSDITYGGTNWQAALEYGKDELDKKKAADEAAAEEGAEPESYYCIFITDGEPTYYGNGTRWANASDGYQGNGGSYDATGQSRANTAAKAIVDAGYNFDSIFAFGSGNTQQNYLRRTTVYAYDGVDYSGNNQAAQRNREKYDNQYFFDAQDVSGLMSAFQHMIDEITSSVGFGRVSFTDGMSTDVTASTLVAGQATGFMYTVSGAVGNLYTVTAEGDDVRFNIAGTEYTSSTDPAVTRKNGEDGKPYYSVTISNTEYKMALASMNEDGIITWDLGAIGALMNGYTYKVSFIVWPDQLAYDYVAGLNNGLPGYVWDDSIAVWDEEAGYYKGGVAEYPSIVKYPSGVYSVLTNTQQSLTYSVITTNVDEEGNVETIYGDPQTLSLDTPKPMDLKGSSVDIEKVWESGLAINELQELIFGTDGVYTDYKVVLNVYEDDGQTPYMTFTFPELNEDGQPVDADGNVTTDVTKLVWSEELAIAPGIMVSETAAEHSGLDVTGYTSVTMDVEVPHEDEEGNIEYVTETHTFYVLPHAAGHDYVIEEAEGQDEHFDFSTVVYHPMLVDDVLKNVKFEVDAEGNIISGSVAEVIGANELQTFEAFNTLRGGLNIYKNIGIDNTFAQIEYDEEGNPTGVTVDETKLVEGVEDEFAFTITFTDKDGNPAYTDPDLYTLNEDGSLNTYVSGFFHYQVRDAAGERLPGAAGRGPIPEGGVITLVMPANGSIRIANMPAGTEFTVTEVEDDSEEKVYNFLLVSGDLTKGDNHGVITSSEFITATTENNYEGKAVGNAAVDLNFYNYTDSYFYVYHSADNEVERISFADSRVKGTYDTKNEKYVYEFDIVNEVKAESNKHDFLYGGYYNDYAGKSEGYDSTAVEEWDENNKYVDEEGTPYRYEHIETDVTWNYDDAFAVSGFKMNPEPKKTYYLKEVPTGYIQPYTQYTYYKSGYRLANLYEITSIDDLNYKNSGFVVQTERGMTIYRTLSIRAANSTSVTTLSPEKTFKAQGVKKGYMGYAEITDIIGLEVTGITQFWDTKDNVRVFGIKQRKLNNGTTITTFKKTDTDYDNKPIDLNSSVEEDTEEGGE